MTDDARSPRGIGDEKEVARLTKVWSDFRTSFTRTACEPDDARLELLAWAVADVGQELEPPLALGTRREGAALVIMDGERPRVVGMGNVTDGDWRTMMAFRVFAQLYGRVPSFARWRHEERPLSQLASLRSLLGLEGHTRPIAAASSGPG